MIPQERIRNFSIVAHIDHGKSTLADRLLEMTHTIDKRLMTSQVLDSMDLEREKGITIKARAVRLQYDAADGQTYALNLIDTPGHVDFTYEVSRSLQACEGAILVVDASQGIEAQTLANVHLAFAQNLVIIPVINKIDLPSADPEMVIAELEDTLAIPREEVILASAKDGTGVDQVLEAIVQRIPPPRGDASAPLQALVFDSHYDQYKGVVAYVRVANGTLHDHERIRFMATGVESDILELGYFRPQPVPTRSLTVGEVGYVASGLKSIAEARVGDTLTDADKPAPEPLPGYQQALPLVFAGLYPMRGDDYPLLREALDKLHLNDASFVYEPESSVALGFGFRCGFLGLLHMEIVQERLEREFDLDLLASAPSVEYRVRAQSSGRRGGGRQPGQDARPRRDRGDQRAVGGGPGHHADRLHRADHGAGHHPARPVRQHGVPGPEARQPALRAAAGRADHRLLRPAQEPHQRVRQPRLPVHRLPARATWSSWTCWSTASRWTRSR